jgi:hypothetical protein
MKHTQKTIIINGVEHTIRWCKRKVIEDRFKYVNIYDYQTLLQEERQGKIKIYFCREGLKTVLLKYKRYLF